MTLAADSEIAATTNRLADPQAERAAPSLAPRQLLLLADQLNRRRERGRVVSAE